MRTNDIIENRKSYSLKAFLTEHFIVIPALQRDYA